MGLASMWQQPSELEALWTSASANVPVCLVLGGIIGILVSLSSLAQFSKS